MPGYALVFAFFLSTFVVPCAHAERAGGIPIGQETSKPVISIDAPSGGWSVDRMISVEGSVSDTSIDPVLLSINGDRYLLRTIDGRFSRKFPAAAGKNVVTVMATNRGGTSYAQASVYAQVPPVPLKVILTSDTDGVYTDLHVYEPTARSTTSAMTNTEKNEDKSKSERGGSEKRGSGGSRNSIDARQMAHVYWANTASPSGGTFFLNSQGGSFDQPGYGPYLYIHRAPPNGVYAVSANYWPSGDKAHTVGTLNITLFEGTAGELRQKVQIPLATPGTTKVLAWINVLSSDRALIYIPSSNPPPTTPEWPSNLQEATAILTSSSH